MQLQEYAGYDQFPGEEFYPAHRLRFFHRPQIQSLLSKKKKKKYISIEYKMSIIISIKAKKKNE